MRLLFLILVLHQVFAESENGLQLNEEKFAKGINGFSLEFTKNLTYTKDNVLFSPAGIAMTAGMLLKGAQGKVKEDLYKMLDMFQYENKEKIHDMFHNMMTEYKEMATREKNPRNASLKISNLMLRDEKFNLPEELMNVLKNMYEASVDKDNFASNNVAITERLNTFVKERTHGLIPKLFEEPIPQQTVLLLMNVIYFKGFWDLHFDHRSTRNETFHNADKTDVTVPMMVRHKTSYKYYHCTEHKARFVQLPYKGDMSMYILLPDEKDGLQKLVEGWKKDELKDMITHMKYTSLNLMLPKFEYEHKIDLLGAFDKMGINIRPVWSSIDPALFVSSALHNAKIKVHEAGTEAAAVTVIQFEFLSANRPVQVVEFKVDHPFVFVIRDDKSGVNLFVGTVNKL